MTAVHQFTPDRSGGHGRFWGRAGERLSEEELHRRRTARAYRRSQEQQIAEEAEQAAHRGWRLGLVAPWRITTALDAGSHKGPEVDIACGTKEPAVDEWEAGTRYPTFEQLKLLAELTGYRVDWFIHTDEPVDVRQTTMWGHMSKRERQRWREPVLMFTDDAVANCPGTADCLATHLF
ncbi:MAG: hypothetical protein WAW17_21585 [Rhodococcus sp. (in: high G+C Gram-positive bacteria)]|uniref:hypothetical protein n=1 Tax=Rhodococcus sp. TaxID=1831 RepID=UPI003BB13661